MLNCLCIKNGRLFALVCLSLSLSACGIRNMGNCGAFCGKGNVVRSTLGAPPKNPLLGQIVSLGHPKKGKHWVWGRRTIERIGELPNQPKTDARRYIPNISTKKAQGSRWYSTTWGSNTIDPRTKAPRKDFPIKSPAVPPGVYRLTSRVSFIDAGQFAKYLPFKGKPKVSTIVVEAGKTTILSSRRGIDTSTQPITAWVDVVQLSSKEALPLMYKNPKYLVSPNMQVAEPLSTTR